MAANRAKIRDPRFFLNTELQRASLMEPPSDAA
jgi:hypothetical protein